MTFRAAPREPFSQRVDVLRQWTHINDRWPSAVSRNDDERRLGRWVQTQRDRHRQGLLTADTTAILGGIPGWTWGSGITGPNSTRGDRGIEQLRAWMTTRPDMPRYVRDRQERRLSDLVSRHRRRYRDGHLPVTRISALESIPGWSWQSSGNRSLGEVAGQLEQWIAEHGRLPSRGMTATEAERGLAVWIAGQRQRYRLGNSRQALWLRWWPSRVGPGRHDPEGPAARHNHTSDPTIAATSSVQLSVWWGTSISTAAGPSQRRHQRKTCRRLSPRPAR